MVEFLKEGDKFLCTNGHGSVFGEIFMLEDGLYYYSDNYNIGGCYTWHTLKCIQEKLVELNSFKKQKYGFNDHMEPKQYDKIQDVLEVLNQRQKTHGEFSEVSKTYADFIKILEKTGFFNKCEDHHRLAIDVIFQKLARILNGDMNFYDHWVDICGYSELVKKELDKNKKQD